MEKEVRYIIDVPKSYFEHCLKRADKEHHKKELRAVLKQIEEDENKVRRKK